MTCCELWSCSPPADTTNRTEMGLGVGRLGLGLVHGALAMADLVLEVALGSLELLAGILGLGDGGGGCVGLHEQPVDLCVFADDDLVLLLQLLLQTLPRLLFMDGVNTAASRT